MKLITTFKFEEEEKETLLTAAHIVSDVAQILDNVELLIYKDKDSVDWRDISNSLIELTS